MAKIYMFRVLLVEDSHTYRQILKEMLQYQFPSFAILEAGDGKEAFQKISLSPPDLIFMDVRLPGENGLEVMKKIKDQHPDMIVVILTSHDTPEYREAASQYKADHFLAKGSTTGKSILALVQSILSNQPNG